MDVLINAANILYVVAYFTTDMLRLRLLTLVAATCLAVFFLCQPTPLLNVVAWNVFFIVLNLAQLLRLLRARRKPTSLPRNRPHPEHVEGRGRGTIRTSDLVVRQVHPEVS